MFYTEGSSELQEARMKIAMYSLPRATKRLQDSQFRRSNLGSLHEEDMKLQSFLNSVPQYDIVES